MAKKITIHTITPMGVNCANRDDMGDVKTAVIGGVVRQRRSSQNIKRPIRMGLAQAGITIGYRGRRQHDKLAEELVSKHGWAPADAGVAAKLFVMSLASNIKETDKVSKYMDEEVSPKASSIVSMEEIEAWADVLSAEVAPQNRTPAADSPVGGKAGYLPFLGQNGISAKLLKAVKEALKNKNSGISADIGMFGRMMASASDLSVDAAVSFSHSISTHASSVQQDFYVCKGDDEATTGSDMMGNLSFAASIMYGYCTINLDLLAANLQHLTLADRQVAVASLVEGVVLSRSSARGNTMAADQLPSFIRVVVHSGQAVEADFTTPVSGDNLLEKSINQLRWCLDSNTKFLGARSGILASLDYEAGVTEGVTLDNLVGLAVGHVV